MTTKRKRLWIAIAVSATICIALLATAMLFHPKRSIVIDIDGEATEINAVFIVDV